MYIPLDRERALQGLLDFLSGKKFFPNGRVSLVSVARFAVATISHRRSDDGQFVEKSLMLFQTVRFFGR